MGFGIFNIVFPLIVIAFAIIGGTTMGVSGCNISVTPFCTDNSLFICGYVFLLLALYTLIAWPTSLLFYECYRLGGFQDGYRLFILGVSILVLSALVISGSTLVGVSGCQTAFCKTPLFIAGFVLLMVFAFLALAIIFLTCWWTKGFFECEAGLY